MEEKIDTVLRVSLADMYKEEEISVGFVKSLTDVTYQDAAYWFRLGYTTALMKVKKEMNKT